MAMAQGVGGVPVTSAPVDEWGAPKGQKALFFGGPTPFLCQALSRREQPGWTAARAGNQEQRSCPVSSPRRRETGRCEQAQRDGWRCQKKWGRENTFPKGASLCPPQSACRRTAPPPGGSRGGAALQGLAKSQGHMPLLTDAAESCRTLRPPARGPAAPPAPAPPGLPAPVRPGRGTRPGCGGPAE